MRKLKKILFCFIFAVLSAQASYAQFEIICLSSIQDVVTKEYTTRIHWKKDTATCNGTLTYEIYEANSKNSIGNLVGTAPSSDSSITLTPTFTPPKFIYIKSIKPSCFNQNSFTKVIEINNGVGLGPDKPILDSVSVDSLNKAFVSWINNPVTPIDSITVYRFDTVDAANSKIATVADTIFYYNTNSKANSQIEQYSIAIKDACQTLSTISERFSTILMMVNYNKCKKETEILWSPYNNFTFGVDKYELHMVTSNKDSILQSSDSLLSYTHSNLDFDTQYIYYVKAKAKLENKSSTSNRDTIKTQVTRNLDRLELITVSIENDTPIITGMLDDSTYYNYKLFRSDNNSVFNLIDSLTIDSTFLQYADTSADPKNNRLKYMVVAYDSCLLPLDSTKIHTTSKIKVTSGSFLNNLSWENYLVNDSNITTVNSIFRLKDATWETTPFYSSTNKLDSTFTDDLRLYYVSDNEFCYYIESIVNGNSVKSNIMCDKQQTLIFIPSGFVANTVDEFKPNGSFIGDNNYKLQIFNRWGIKVFESTDKKVGWTGKDMPAGTYVYLVDYQINTGENFIKRGTVILVR